MNISSKEYIEYCELSWKIIEAKIIYYIKHSSWRGLPKISDTEYDNMELRYLSLCKKYNYNNTVVHKSYPQYEDMDYSKAMLEVDMSRSSVQLAYNKLHYKYSSKHRKKPIK